MFVICKKHVIMKTNTYSLLSGSWMFAGNSQTALYPYLFNVLNGKSVSTKNTMAATVFKYQSKDGVVATINNNKAPNTSSVAVINIHHPIFKYDQECGPKGTQSIMNVLDAWKTEPSILGVVLNVNSGGGQASGTAEFAEYLSTYPKPIEVFTKDVIGSAAYYFSAATNKITAHKHADFIGCIGTMWHSVNLEGVIKKKGGLVNEIYSDLSPEKNKQSRALKKGDPKPLIEKILNPHAQKFHEDMKTYRPTITDKALKGDVYNPKEALQEGLIDALGTLDDVVESIFNSVNKNNNKPQNTMSELKIPFIEKAIGDSFSNGEKESGILLQEDQATLLESVLKDNQEKIDGLTLKSNSSIELVNTLQDHKTAVTTAIQAALKEAEVEDCETMSNEDGIKALSGLIKLYGGKDGASLTTVTATTNQVENENVKHVSGVNLDAAMNN